MRGVKIVPLNYHRQHCMLMLYIIYVYCSTQLRNGGRSDKSVGLLKTKPWKNSILLEEIGKRDSTLEKIAFLSRVREGPATYCKILQKNKIKEKDSIIDTNGFHLQH